MHPSVRPSRLAPPGWNATPHEQRITVRLEASTVMRVQSHPRMWKEDASDDRVYLITDEHPPMRRLLNQGTALVSRTYREGAFHHAHELLWSTGASTHASDWIALIPTYSAQNPDGSLSDATLRLARAEHRHNQRVTAAASDLLPRYAGMALILGARGSNSPSPGRVRVAHLWRRKDATLQDLVDQGGLIGGAGIGDHRLSLDDLRVLLLRLARMYQRLHTLGLVYTDPKPANIAIDLAVARTAWIPGGSPPATHARRPLSTAGHEPGGESSMRLSAIGGVCFIDAESMQPPGYATDDAVEVVTSMTPSWMSPLVLGALGTHHELKRRQASEAADVFHLTAIAYALITGESPQATLMDERSMDPRLLDDEPCSDQPTRFTKAAIEVRLQGNYERERSRLQYLCDSKQIPAALADLMLSGLNGGLSGFAPWISCLHSICWTTALA